MKHDWTKPEAYTDKGIAWVRAKEWIRGRSITGVWKDEADLIPPRFIAEWGGRRCGKTARMMGYDLSSGPDKSVRAKWINGRLWILEDDNDG